MSRGPGRLDSTLIEKTADESAPGHYALRREKINCRRLWIVDNWLFDENNIATTIYNLNAPAEHFEEGFLRFRTRTDRVERVTAVRDARAAPPADCDDDLQLAVTKLETISV
ncbi:hypothetical protein EVAR_8350_1 [Eumeta japonica]|uniref:Uncharacterized protein n=1 Tax=Eumeta variegata TaxID=151549 RepID=A0A4C1VE50_EUMVA|nr:hypothetical protein EVAR_8350_1 [Eumeta japonica]